MDSIPFERIASLRSELAKIAAETGNLDARDALAAALDILLEIEEWQDDAAQLECCLDCLDVWFATA